MSPRHLTTRSGTSGTVVGVAHRGSPSREASGIAVRAFGSVVAAALLATGCVPHVDEQTTRTPRPSVSERPRITPERRDLDPEVDASVEGNAVKVRVQQKTECRDVISTPMEQDEITRRTLSNGQLAQAGNLVLGGGLLALGIAGFASIGSSCSANITEPTEQNPNPPTRPCTTDEQKEQNTRNAAIGGVSTGLALVPLGLFVWNILRAKDEKKTTPLSAKVEETTWEGCDVKPLPNAMVSLQAGSVSASAKTDAEGKAIFDLDQFATSKSDPKQATVGVEKDGRSASTSIALTMAPFYERWNTSPLAQAERRAAVASSMAPKVDHCAGWFVPETATVRATQHQLMPDDVREQTSLADSECNLEALRKGIVGGSPLADFMRGCRKRKGNEYCSTREQMIASGQDPNAPELNERRFASIGALQGQKVAAAVLSRGRQAIFARLKSPSTAKVVREASAVRCPSGITATVHELDAQNSFGAMLRQQHCALVPSTGAAIPVSCDLIGGALKRLQDQRAVPFATACNAFEAISVMGFEPHE